MSVVYLGIGSNIGNRSANCEEAVKRLGATRGLKVTARSRFYLTNPVGGPPQEDYLNGVLKIETDIPPEELLNAVKTIEKEMGRTGPYGKNSPRIIDLDILLYDDVVVNTGGLVIPHPRAHERYFVLEGLSEIAPDAVHPVLGKTAKELCEENERRDSPTVVE